MNFKTIIRRVAVALKLLEPEPHPNVPNKYLDDVLHFVLNYPGVHVVTSGTLSELKETGECLSYLYNDVRTYSAQELRSFGSDVTQALQNVTDTKVFLISLQAVCTGVRFKNAHWSCTSKIQHPDLLSQMVGRVYGDAARGCFNGREYISWRQAMPKQAHLQQTPTPNRDLWALWPDDFMCPAGEIEQWTMMGTGVARSDDYRMVEVLEYDGTGAPVNWRPA